MTYDYNKQIIKDNISMYYGKPIVLELKNARGEIFSTYIMTLNEIVCGDLIGKYLFKMVKQEEGVLPLKLIKWKSAYIFGPFSRENDIIVRTPSEKEYKQYRKMLICDIFYNKWTNKDISLSNLLKL